MLAREAALFITEEQNSKSLGSPTEPKRLGGAEVCRLIKDEFTDLEISRQRRWQLRHAKEGKCIICAGRAVPGTPRCCKHHVQQALRNHERKYPGKKPLNSKWLKLASVLQRVPAHGKRELE